MAEDLELVQSSVMYRVGGRFYPMKVSARCRTCNSPYRSHIENQILCGFSYKQISESLPEDFRLSARQIADHYRNGHMPLAEAARRAIVERRARVKQLDAENGLDNLVDHMTVLETIVRDGTELMARREIQPTVKEVMAAAAALADIEAEGDSGADWEDVNRGIQHVMEMARAHMTSQQFLEFSKALVSDRYLKKLIEGETVGELEMAALPQNINRNN